VRKRERDAGRWHYLTGTLAAKIQRDNLIGRRQGRPWRRVADQCRRHAWNCGVEDIDEINSLLRDYGKQITTHTHTHTARHGCRKRREKRQKRGEKQNCLKI